MLLDSYKMKEEDVKTYFPLVLAWLTLSFSDRFQSAVWILQAFKSYRGRLQSLTKLTSCRLKIISRAKQTFPFELFLVNVWLDGRAKGKLFSLRLHSLIIHWFRLFSLQLHGWSFQAFVFFSLRLRFNFAQPSNLLSLLLTALISFPA